MTFGRLSDTLPRPSRHRGAASLAAALTAGLVVACVAPMATMASAPPTDGPTADSASESSGGEFVPVTIDHRYGATEITERPERIVSLDGQWTDALVALGTPPVGYATDWNIEGAFPWLGEELADRTPLDTIDGIPFEQVAALEPDLIVISWGAQDEAMYEDLAEIAPTIASVSEAVVDPWQDITATAGRFLGQQEGAEQLIADVERQIAEVSSEFPELAGKTFAFANYIPGDKIYVLTDPADGAIAFFMALGLELPDGLIDGEGPPGGRYEISFEQIGRLDADVLIMLTNGADTTEITGFDQLSAVENGAYALLDYEGAVSLNVPSPLSIPFGIDAVRPALEAAAS